MYGPNRPTEAKAIAAWNRLSEAVALLGACERIQQAAGDVLVSIEHQRRLTVVDRVLTPEGRTGEWKCYGTPFSNPDAYDDYGRYPTLAAALVALADAPPLPSQEGVS